jgi:hypothetical protein
MDGFGGKRDELDMTVSKPHGFRPTRLHLASRSMSAQPVEASQQGGVSQLHER